VRKNCQTKHAIEGKMEGNLEVTVIREEDVTSSWVSLRKREDAGN
jgi:hypothetical protein